jgi:hypothetical protein
MPKRRYQPDQPVISEKLLADIDPYIANICDRIGPPNLSEKMNVRCTKGRAK